MVGPPPTRPSDPHRPFRQRRLAVVAAALAAGALALVGCGTDDEAAEATPTPTRSTAPAPTSSESLAASASEAPGSVSESSTEPSQTPSAAQPTATQLPPPVAPTAVPTTPLPIPSGSYATVWPAPEGTVPGRCGGNGIDARMYLNGWELCWTEGTISEPFAVNVAQTLAVSNFASGVYDVPSPSGMKTVECTNFVSQSTRATIIACSGGTITGNGAIELAWLG